MRDKIVKLIKEPKKYLHLVPEILRLYLPLIPKILQQHLCFLFRGTAFFMQGQMDINPQSRWYNPNFVNMTGGYFPVNEDNGERQIVGLEPWDTTRRDMLILLLRTILQNKIQGDFAELGVYRGYSAKLFHYYIPERKLHLFDTFEGFNWKDVLSEMNKTGKCVPDGRFADISLDRVKKYISPQNDNVIFYRGYFPDSIPEGFDGNRFAFVHLDADLYEPTYKGLQFFYPRMNPGGFLIVHDYNAWPGVRKAVDEFFLNKIEVPVPMPDKSGSALIIKHKGAE